MRPKPIDPSAIVDTAAGLSLHSVMIVWCSALPVRKPPPCPLAHTHNLMYAYGDGYLSSPQEASPPFFWITESRDLKARKPSIKMKQGGGPIVGCEGNVCHTGQDTVLWLVTIIVPKRRLEIDIMSNQPYAAVNAVSVGLLHAGGR